MSVIKGVDYQPDGTPFEEEGSNFFGAYIITAGAKLMAVYDASVFTPQSAVAHFGLKNKVGVPGIIVDYAMWDPLKEDRLLARIRFRVCDDGHVDKEVNFFDPE